MINIELNIGPITLSSMLNNVKIQTDSEWVDFIFEINGNEVLSERFYTLGGYIRVTALGELVENYLRTSEVNIAQCSIDVNDNSGEEKRLDFRVLYCANVLNISDVSDWLENNYLNAGSFYRVCDNDYIRLHWFSERNNNLDCRVFATYFGHDGARGVYSYEYASEAELTKGNGLYDVAIPLTDIAQTVCNDLELNAVNLIAVTVVVGSRSATYYIDQSLSSGRVFFFVNCFNAVEQMRVNCTTTTKTKSERPVALIGRETKFYDVHNSKEFETLTAPLSAHEFSVIEQLMLSENVRIILDGNVNERNDFNAMAEIVITDFTCELSDSDSELGSVKFTWQFSDSTPQLSNYTSPGIFNDNFNFVFS